MNIRFQIKFTWIWVPASAQYKISVQNWNPNFVKSPSLTLFFCFPVVLILCTEHCNITVQCITCAMVGIFHCHSTPCVCYTSYVCVCVCVCPYVCICKHFFFQFKITYAPWPTSPYHDSFYDDYVSGRPYEHQYRFIREKTLRNTSSEERHADNERVFKNFLGVHVYLDQHAQFVCWYNCCCHHRAGRDVLPNSGRLL